MEMKSIEHLDHTADLGLKVTAPTVEELFELCANGMFTLILSPEHYSRPKELMDINLQAESRTDLLREWLSELLYFHATRRMIFSKLTVTSLEGNRLEGVAEGFQLSPEQAHLATEVKAVTYHALYLRETEAGFEAQVVFDT